MKFPREINRYCPFCKAHKIHVVEEVKKHKASELKWGQRRFRRVTAGYRGFPRPKPDRKKPAHRKDTRLKCKECGKQHIKALPRSKRFEFIK